MKAAQPMLGLSLSSELSALADFRTEISEKLRLIENLLSAINNSIMGREPGYECIRCNSAKGGPNDLELAITRDCLVLLVASAHPLTIGEICAELQSSVNLEAACEDPLLVVSKSLQYLASHCLAIPVERQGVRKWVWTGNEGSEYTNNTVVARERQLVPNHSVMVCTHDRETSKAEIATCGVCR
jgi:hypothetical protein